MKQKEIHEFIKEIVILLQKKVKSYEEDNSLTNEEGARQHREIVEYAKGQLFEAGYILENVERIIYKD